MGLFAKTPSWNSQHNRQSAPLSSSSLARAPAPAVRSNRCPSSFGAPVLLPLNLNCYRGIFLGRAASPPPSSFPAMLPLCRQRNLPFSIQYTAATAWSTRQGQDPPAPLSSAPSGGRRHWPASPRKPIAAPGAPSWSHSNNAAPRPCRRTTTRPPPMCPHRATPPCVPWESLILCCRRNPLLVCRHSLSHLRYTSFLSLTSFSWVDLLYKFEWRMFGYVKCGVISSLILNHMIMWLMLIRRMCLKNMSIFYEFIFVSRTLLVILDFSHLVYFV
jgi:hypothetical protein